MPRDDGLLRDLRFAVRALRRTPGFTVVTVLSLGLGLTLVASVLAVVNAYLILSLPYPASDRLYHVMYAPPGPWEPRGMSALDWQAVADVVEFPVAAASETFYLGDGGYAQAVRGLRVSNGFLDGLGIRAAAGRPLTAEDFGTPEPAALIGHSLWRDRFGSDPAILGRSIRADTDNRAGEPENFRIVGVLPPDFYYGRDSSEKVDLLVPLTERVRTYMVRLREGVPPALAERRITEAARSVGVDIPPDWAGVRLESVHGRYVAGIRPALIGVTTASALVMLIVCTNVAVLMVLRALRRQKETAVRVALGAGWRDIARMVFAEAVVVCAAALAAGLGLTSAALGLLSPIVETELGRPAPGGAEAIAVDGTVMLVLGGTCALMALAFSFLPLLTPWAGRLAEVLRQDGRTASDGRPMRRARAVLVALEVAGALVLVTSSGLMIRGVADMLGTDLGTDTDRLVRSRIVLRAASHPDPASFSEFYESFTGRLSALTRSPVVFANWPPFVEYPTQEVEIDADSSRRVDAGATAVGAGYFAMLGIDVRSGREFTAGDRTGTEPVAVVSESLAVRLRPGETPIGRRVRVWEQTPRGPAPGPWRTVIGVAADVRQTYADAERADVYVPFTQAAPGRFGSFYMRTDRPAPSLLSSMRAVAREIDPAAVVATPRPVESENRELAGARVMTSMLTGFATLSLLLAVLGIYSVTAYTVEQRAREVAIRVAVGASGCAIVRLFLRDGSAVLAAGATLGLVGAAAAAHVLQQQVYGVPPFDLFTIGATCLLVVGAGLCATWWPATRAAARSPIVALNGE